VPTGTRIDARPVQIELLVAETVCESLAARDHLGAHHRA
jgi:hypothetical protein